MSRQPDYLWHCPATDRFIWAHWDEESLLFDCRSGQTHSLTPLAVEIIFLLERNNLSTDAIVEQLTQMFGDIGEHGSAGKLAELLEHFAALGLIEECLQ